MEKLKNILKTLKAKKIIRIVFILVLIFVLLLPSIIYYITIDDGTYKEGDWKSTPYVASDYTSGITINENGVIPKTNVQELWDTMIKNGNNIKDYLDKPEELEKLLNAEIVTQYPKIGNGSSTLDGIIEFERHKTDGTSSKLSYIAATTFDEYVNNSDERSLNYFTIDGQGNAVVAVLNTTTEEITSNDDEFNVGEYSSNLTQDNKVKDGNYKKVEKVISKQTINYKNFVQRYTMPFQYLWSLLVIGDDKDFVLELADLVQNSQITISIYDNITTNTNVDQYVYYKESRIDTYARLSIPNTFGVKKIPTERYWLSDKSPNASGHYNEKYQAGYSKDATEYNVTHTTTYETDNPIIDMTKANVWIVDYSKDYAYQSSENTLEESNTKSLEDTDFVLDSNSPEKSDDNPLLLNDLNAQTFAGEVKAYIEKNRTKTESNTTTSKNTLTLNTIDSFKDEKKTSKNSTTSIKDSIDTSNPFETTETEESVEVNVAYVECNKYNHKIERKQTVTNTTQEQKYVAQTPNKTYKVEKKDGEVNFVTILCKSTHKNARYLITSEIDSWLFELLETNPDTKDMVDITRFLLNKVTDSTRFGEYDESLLDSLYGGNINSSGTTVVNGDINVNDESIFITDIETLKKAFNGYSNSAKLVEHAQDFLNMQSKYKVNALFAAAVSIAETGAGNAGNAVKITTTANSFGASIGLCWNNWFNIKTSDAPYGIVYNGEGTSHYKIYNSVGDSIDNFGSNIANGNYYYKQGKYTVNDIGHTYCPNSAAYPTQGDDWVEHTLSYINNFYNAAGITVNTLNSGSFVQYYQGDYASVQYGESTLAACGCGPTSFAMIASTLKGQNITPADAVAWCGNSYYVYGSGTSWSYFSAAASHFELGVSVTQTYNINDAITALKNGKYVISSQGPGLFTTGGHFIVLSAIDSSGNITVKDPNKANAVTKGYNNRTFTSTEINQAAKGYWIFN